MTADGRSRSLASVQYRTKPEASNEPYILLLRREWDDTGYQTSFEVCHVRPGEKDPELFGVIKILQRGAKRTVLPEAFEALSDEYCSWVQSDEFSRRVHDIDLFFKICRDLRNLRELNGADRESHQKEPGFEKSLLRLSSARYQHALWLGHIARKFSVRVVAQLMGFEAAHDAEFEFDADDPLRRVAVLVGENGTGKTQFLDAMARSLAGMGEAQVTTGCPFSQVVVVSCNVFDQYMIPSPLVEESYRYVGPRAKGKINVESIPGEVASWIPEIQAGVANWDAWSFVLKELGLSHLWGSSGDLLAEEIAKLGAGYKYACYAFAGLLRHLDIGALVLYDEPENHTHPRLLSAMLRCFHHILGKFQAFGVIATHSPLVLQEVPARQIRVLRCIDGALPLFTPLRDQSFGASLNEILRHAFGIDYTKNNFDIAIRRRVAEVGVNVFREQMGEELTLAAEIVLDEIEGEAKS